MKIKITEQDKFDLIAQEIILHVLDLCEIQVLLGEGFIYENSYILNDRGFTFEVNIHDERPYIACEKHGSICLWDPKKSTEGKKLLFYRENFNYKKFRDEIGTPKIFKDINNLLESLDDET